MIHNIIKNLLENFDKHLINKKKNLSALKKDINFIKKKILNRDDFHLVIKNFEKNPKKMEDKLIKFSKLFGKPLAQNKKNEKYVKIIPNVKLINKRTKDKSVKLRYHQTNAGGAIHSDGPQLTFPPKYVIMGCIKQADKGGSSIIASAKKIADFLKIKNPDIFNLLQKNFLFERRGFSYPNNNILKSPIFKIKKNIFKFRYLREYIEAAYKIDSKILNKKNIEALDILDNLLTKKEFQIKYKLNTGDVIILNNNFLAHGRSSFRLNNINQRTLMRIWLR